MYGPGMKWFDKQDDAISHCESQGGDDDGVFALQKFGGRRRFLSSSYPNFCEKYLALNSELCHFYEIIRRDTPCKLYFDIDVKMTTEYNVDGYTLTDMFLNYVTHCLFVKYQKCVERSEILVLDSSSPEKFSQHILFPRIHFQDNTHCGNFVKSIASAAKVYVDGGGETDYTRDYNFGLDFLYTDKDCFVADLAVYTRNSHFRLWGSSELDSSAYLDILPDCLYPIEAPQQAFYASVVLIPGLVGDPELLMCEEPKKVEASSSTPNREIPQPMMATDPSKYPRLYSFVMQHIRSNSNYQEAIVPHIVEYNHKRLLNFPIKGSNWCENARREHKGNRPYYFINKDTGCLYGQCHSRKCRGYRSVPVQIPEELLHELSEDDVESELSD